MDRRDHDHATEAGLQLEAAAYRHPASRIRPRTRARLQTDKIAGAVGEDVIRGTVRVVFLAYNPLRLHPLTDKRPLLLSELRHRNAPTAATGKHDNHTDQRHSSQQADEPTEHRSQTLAELDSTAATAVTIEVTCPAPVAALCFQRRPPTLSSRCSRVVVGFRPRPLRRAPGGGKVRP